MSSLIRRHRIFLAILGIGTLVRAVAGLAYHPALWFPDSLSYAAVAEHPYPTVIRPAGYPLLLLWPLHWFHSFLAVVVVQHLLGLVAGCLVYALLLRRGMQRWAAALASAPVLLSAYEIQIEHFILSDSLFTFLLVAAITALLWNPSPGWPECVIAGVLFGTAAIVRSEGLPLVAGAVLWLAIRHGSPWRTRLLKVTLIGIAFMLPVGSYAVWFHESYGQYRLTYSTGPFLAARAESFASCPATGIPGTDRWLCAAPGRAPDWYLWNTAAPLFRDKHGEFTRASDQRGTSFALHIFVAQPAAYLSATWRDVLQNFSSQGSGDQAFAFPASQPPTVASLAAANRGSAVPIYPYDPSPSTRLSQPWVSILRIYQQIVVIPPIATALIVLAGLAGLVLCREYRGGSGLLPWLIGVTLLVFPAATSGFGARYELVSLAPLCIAAVLGMAEITAEPARRLAHAAA